MKDESQNLKSDTSDTIPSEQTEKVSIRLEDNYAVGYSHGYRRAVSDFAFFMILGFAVLLATRALVGKA